MSSCAGPQKNLSTRVFAKSFCRKSFHRISTRIHIPYGIRLDSRSLAPSSHNFRRGFFSNATSHPVSRYVFQKRFIPFFRFYPESVSYRYRSSLFLGFFTSEAFKSSSCRIFCERYEMFFTRRSNNRSPGSLKLLSSLLIFVIFDN